MSIISRGKIVNGKPVPLTPEELIKDAVRYLVAEKLPPQGWMYHAISVHCSGDIRVLENTKKVRSVMGQGEVFIGKRDAAKNKIYPPAQHTFTVEVKDVIDALGQPDIDVINYTFQG